MNCIIIDDEPLALLVIEEHIKKIPFLNLIAKCSNAFDALEIMRIEPIDLLFLDIHMPVISGLEFINSLQHKPLIIFTTAYSEYAIEAFELNAIDYLLKPIPFERFFKAVNKAVEYHALKNQKSTQNAPIPAVYSIDDTEKVNRFIVIKSEYQSIKIDTQSILYIEGFKDYVKIFTVQQEKPITTLMPLKKIEQLLPPKSFIRIHRSFIVAVEKINSFTKNRIIVNSKWLPIGESYKNDFIQKMNIS